MVIMKQKALRTCKGKAIRRTVAAAVFAAATTVAGCGEFPQCPVYFNGKVAKQCSGFLENMKKAKAELKAVKGHKKYVKVKLRERVIEKGNMEGLDVFNRVCEELDEVSGEIERLRLLEIRVKRGDAKDVELLGVNERVLDIIAQLNEMARELVSI